MKTMTAADANVSEGGRESSSDQALVRRAVDGDRTAFALLVERHYDFVYRVAFRWCRNRTDAEDIAQEVCARLGKAIRNFRGASAFTTWLYALTINAARDMGRKFKRDTEKAEAWGQQSRLFGEAEGDDAERLWELVAALPAKQRDAVLLVYGEGLSHAAAGDVMACAETTVSWHIHEAKKRLKRLMAEAGEE
jgi:RNA polymerase sigma-70 factor (ECF subfamily)